MNDQPVQSRDTYRNVIINTRDGKVTELGGSDEHATVTPDGGHDFKKIEIRTTTLDGYVLQPKDEAFQCTKCLTGPWSRTIMTRCAACRHYACVTCTAQTPAGPLCTSCAKALRRQVLRAWFLSIL